MSQEIIENHSELLSLIPKKFRHSFITSLFIVYAGVQKSSLEEYEKAALGRFLEKKLRDTIENRNYLSGKLLLKKAIRKSIPELERSRILPLIKSPNLFLKEVEYWFDKYQKSPGEFFRDEYEFSLVFRNRLEQSLNLKRGCGSAIKENSVIYEKRIGDKRIDVFIPSIKLGIELKNGNRTTRTSHFRQRADYEGILKCPVLLIYASDYHIFFDLLSQRFNYKNLDENVVNQLRNLF
ncbi:MAG: hypothetical protein V7L14_17645 [Nostoc sp.]|uniref:hypothetical protein n=1 Tax=Nostoc sp. TaxID=1180 RepID=UPI002FF9667C